MVAVTMRGDSITGSRLRFGGPGLSALDELQLPLNAQAGALGGGEGDLHAGSLGSITVGHPPCGPL